MKNNQLSDLLQIVTDATREEGIKTWAIGGGLAVRVHGYDLRRPQPYRAILENCPGLIERRDAHWSGLLRTTGKRAFSRTITDCDNSVLTIYRPGIIL